MSGWLGEGAFKALGKELVIPEKLKNKSQMVDVIGHGGTINQNVIEEDGDTPTKGGVGE